jgi:hypothetical protein
MIAAVLLLIFMAAVGAFVAGRVYMGVRNRQLEIRGVLYSWRETPVLYVLVLLAATAATMAISATIGFSVMVLGGWNSI